jgi:predicted membrane protein
MVLPFVPLSFSLGDFFSDMFFVILVLTGSYLLFILYINFKDVPVLFGIAAIIAVVFLVTNTLPVVLVVGLFFVFVMFGQNLQMLLQFSVYPLLGMFGVKVPGMAQEGQEEEMKLKQIEQRILRGEEVSQSDKALLSQSYQGQAQMQQQQQLDQRVLQRRH